MTYAIITVFYPTENVKQNISRIAKQTDVTFICDNSPYANDTLFEPLTEDYQIQYRFFGENRGLSRAFNEVLQDPEYQWKDNDYIFFFDQDSVVSDCHTEMLISTYESVRNTGCDIGCLGPAYFNTSSGKVELPRIKRTVLENTYCVSSIITSSMLCRYADLKQIGFWNEDTFLDMADWDLCWRLQASGKVCCITEAVVLQHSVGTGEKKIGPLRLRVGAPVREYYQIRDCLYLLRKEYTPMKYRLRFLAMILIRSPLHVLCLENRKERLHYIRKGFSDYRGGKHGVILTEEGSATQIPV